MSDVAHDQPELTEEAASAMRKRLGGTIDQLGVGLERLMEELEADELCSRFAPLVEDSIVRVNEIVTLTYWLKAAD